MNTYKHTASLSAPIGVAVTHVVIIAVCGWYDSSLLSLLQLKGWISFALGCSSVYTLFKCALLDPGIVQPRAIDLESPQPKARTLSPRNVANKARKGMEQSEMTVLVGSEADISPKAGQDHVSQPDLRFCATCELHQPLRSKHSNEINRCVRTFDHYCPWIANCVGENNRVWFLVYLACETSALAWFTITAFSSIYASAGRPEMIAAFTALIMAITVMCIFWLMTGLLTSYHIFLACSNLTTWEQTSWRRITYLSALTPSEGSPFSATSILGNLRQYLRHPEAIEIGSDGGVVWRIGPQRSVLPVCASFCYEL